MKFIKEKYYKFTQGIGNLIKWFPIIWRDRNWDESYLLEIMSFKMKQMAELNRNYGHAVNSDEIADQLYECSRLAQRIASNNYMDEAFGDEIYLVDKTVMDFVENENGTKALKFTGLTEREKDRKFELYKKQDNLLEKDIELLFDNMKKNIRTWWD